MRYFLALLFCCTFLFASGQDPIAEKMDWYGKAKSTPSLFVHFDKTIYSNNESVYFTGYLILTDTLASKKHHVLSIALIRDVDSVVIHHDKYFMENGLAFGSMALRDSILTGDYHFIAYTDYLVNGLPEAIFVQPVTLKTSIDPFFKANMKLITDANKSDTKKVLISVTSKDSRFLPRPTLVNYRYGKVVQTTKTDLSGQLLMSLPEQKNISDPNLYVKLKYGSDSSFISMAIPNAKNKASVSFYPEGGNLIEGIPSTIGWEVKDQQKMPVAVKAFLYRNDEVIDTIETSSYGIGKFRLFPIINSTYTVRLVHSALADSSYTLPNVLTNGLVINLPKAVLNDTLRVVLKTNVIQKLMIRLHNFRECFVTVPFQMQLNNQIIKIPLNEVAKGLTTITISDTLDRPLAERMFFAHYDQHDQINITSNKNIYNQREKVTLKVKLINPKNEGIVSVACVQNNRLDLRKTQDIASFIYLTSELNRLPTNLKGNPFADQNYLEQILLVKGWRRYSWQDFEQAPEKIKGAKQMGYLTISGNVLLPRKKSLKTTLVTVGGSGFHYVATDTTGHFNLSYDQLITPDGNKLYLIFDHNEKTIDTEYKIKINDPYLTLNNKLGKMFDPQLSILPSLLQNNQDLILKNNERAIQLKEVLINPYGDDSMTYNQCGDYFCTYRILNCPNHTKGTKGNKPPIKGNYYLYKGASKRYEGCNTLDENIFFKVNPVYLRKEFYINDFHDPLEPAFASTLFWNYGMLLKGDKESEINFFTSDITGKFRVVVQGIVNNGVAYAEHFFEVKGK